MIDFLNSNAGAIQGIATVALLLVTGWYAYTTKALLNEAKQSRRLAGEPRVVAYLRANEVHSNLVQLCVANLSNAAAVGVSAAVTKKTAWPDTFDLQDSPILRDLTFVRAQEVLRFDLGFGPDLFADDKGAVFEVAINFAGLDGRTYAFASELRVESVLGGSWKIYGIDDVARRLKDIADTLKSIASGKRMSVDTYDADDREKEAEAMQRRREEFRRMREEGEG